jgi:hypothetical protein
MENITLTMVKPCCALRRRRARRRPDISSSLP